MPDEITDHILSFDPDSARVLRVVSRELLVIGEEFLKGYAGDSLAACSGANSPLYKLVHDSFVDFSLRLWFQPNRGGIEFHLSIPDNIRQLGICREKCPDKILSPREIGDFNQKIKDCNLRAIWPSFREHIVWNQPELQGVPENNASAGAVATWMLQENNQPTLQAITRLNLTYQFLMFIPVQIRLCSNLDELSLANNKLIFLPEESFQELPALRMLHLANNQLTCLPARLFRGLHSLERLYLCGNQLAALPEQLFSGLARLRLLDISRNPLFFIPDTAFQGLTALQNLSLANNHMSSLPENLLHGLPALQELDLQENRFTSLPEHTFHHLTALELLSLSRNQLASLPENLFRSQGALRELYLHDNQLTTLAEPLFHGLTALQTLFLSGNRLLSLQKGTFQGLTALLKLYLGWNKLAILQEDLFQGLPALQELNIYFNPLLMISESCNWSSRSSFLEIARAFFSYTCTSPLAQLCQLVARGTSSHAVQNLFAQLPDTTKNDLFRRIRIEANLPGEEEPQWREHHAFKSMEIFAAALRHHIRVTFNRLTPNEKNAVYTRIYTLAKNQLGEQQVHADVQQSWAHADIPRKWGELHAHDNVLRLIDAMQLQMTS
jgi:Leucine-rich repeat (LRR) protein